MTFNEYIKGRSSSSSDSITESDNLKFKKYKIPADFAASWARFVDELSSENTYSKAEIDSHKTQS